MNVEEQVLEAKAQNKLLQHKMSALITLLTREGIIDEEEFTEHVELLNKKSDG